MESEECPAAQQWKVHLGRSAWRTIHSLPFGLGASGSGGDDGPERYLQYMVSLRALYPCLECRSHMQVEQGEHFERLRVLVQWVRRAGELGVCTPGGALAWLLLWGVEFHNSVSRTLEKSVWGPAGVCVFTVQSDGRPHTGLTRAQEQVLLAKLWECYGPDPSSRPFEYPDRGVC
jgi:hypothetical protein